MHAQTSTQPVTPAQVIARRWNEVCLDCWQVGNPDQYAPIASGWGNCRSCGWDSMTLNVSAEDLKRICTAWSARPCDYCGERNCTK